MRRKVTLFLVFRTAAMALLATGAAAQTRQAAPEPGTETPAPVGKALVGRYAGTVVCADCPGIRTELSLFEDGRDPFRKTYLLRETYLETRQGDKTVTSRGNWTVLRGSAADSDATVYELTPDGSTASRHFMQADQGTLRMLGGDLDELPPSLPQTLKRVQSGATR